MTLDLRVPIGMMFGLVGALLAVYGVFSDPSIYQASLGINVNLWWGMVLLAFGLVMLVFALRAAKRAAAGVSGA